MAIDGNSCSNKSIIVNIWWRIMRKNSVFDVQKAEKHTHTPTTVAKRDGNSHITLEITHFRHTSEGNVSLPPSFLVSENNKNNKPVPQNKGVVLAQQYRNPRISAFAPRERQIRHPNQEKTPSRYALQCYSSDLATTASGKSKNLSTKSGKDTRPLQRYSVTVHFYPLHTPTL